MATRKPQYSPKAGYEWVQVGTSWMQKRKTLPRTMGRGSAFVQSRYNELLAAKSSEGMASSLKQARPLSSSIPLNMSKNAPGTKSTAAAMPASAPKRDTPKRDTPKPASTNKPSSSTRPKITGKAVSQSNTQWVKKDGKKGYVALKSDPSKKYTGRIKIVEKGSTSANKRGVASYYKGRNVTRKGK